MIAINLKFALDFKLGYFKEGKKVFPDNFIA
jgi:hypothetical protein